MPFTISNRRKRVHILRSKFRGTNWYFFSKTVYISGPKEFVFPRDRLNAHLDRFKALSRENHRDHFADHVFMACLSFLRSSRERVNSARRKRRSLLRSVAFFSIMEVRFEAARNACVTCQQIRHVWAETSLPRFPTWTIPWLGAHSANGFRAELNRVIGCIGSAAHRVYKSRNLVQTNRTGELGVIPEWAHGIVWTNETC